MSNSPDEFMDSILIQTGHWDQYITEAEYNELCEECEDCLAA